MTITLLKVFVALRLSFQKLTLPWIVNEDIRCVLIQQIHKSCFPVHYVVDLWKFKRCFTNSRQTNKQVWINRLIFSLALKWKIEFFEHNSWKTTAWDKKRIRSRHKTRKRQKKILHQWILLRLENPKYCYLGFEKEEIQIDNVAGLPQKYCPTSETPLGEWKKTETVPSTERNKSLSALMILK